jgi:hypothetical protein
MDGSALSEALTQGGFQIGRPVILAQKVAEGFLGQLLEVHHAVTASKSTACHVSSSNWTRFPGISAPPVDPEEIAPRPRLISLPSTTACSKQFVLKRLRKAAPEVDGQSSTYGPHLVKRAARRFTPLRNATVDNFLSAAFSSLKLVVSSRTTSSWPSSSAQAISVPYRAIS